MATRLGMERCFNIKLPKEINDVNDYFWDKNKKQQNFSKDNFKKLVKESRRFEVKDIQSLEYALKDLYKEIYLNEEDEIIGLKTPWDSVNKIISGGKYGQLIVVSAKPKVGKKTWVLNWMKHISQAEEMHTLLYC